jgi:hypothetical protein
MEIKPMSKTHSKIKNVGLLFELLSRQLTQDILSNKQSKAIGIIQEYFKVGSELFKELELYQLLMKQKYESENRAEMFVNEVLKQRRQINNKLLEEQKYKLVKTIKENFDFDSFFKYRVNDYKVFASIYKLFENKKLSPADSVNSKFTLIEHIAKKSVSKNEVITEIQEQYNNLDKTTRALAFKFLIKAFNEKYEKLNLGQKKLLEAYVTNITNSPVLTEYVKSVVPKLKTELSKLNKKTDDEITKIKIDETVKKLDSLMMGSIATDETILQILRYQQLISELKEIVRSKMLND